MKKTSVVICTYNRAHLLKRSLVCYKKQTLKDFELIVLDDNSQDETEELIKSSDLNIKYIKLQDKKPDEWRDAGCIINRGIKMTSGDFIYITHPEVMPCFNCLERMNEELLKTPEVFVNSRTYYMTPGMQKEIDDIDWEGNFYNIRNIKDFYKEEPLYKEQNLQFLNEQCTTKYAETTEDWLSWVFGGMTRKKWKEFGGLNEYRRWGSVDMDFMERRKEYGIITVTPKDVYVIHQNHDEPVGLFRPTKRSLQLLVDEVKRNYDKKINFLEDMEM